MKYQLTANVIVQTLFTESTAYVFNVHTEQNTILYSINVSIYVTQTKFSQTASVSVLKDFTG